MVGPGLIELVLREVLDAEQATQQACPCRLSCPARLPSDGVPPHRGRRPPPASPNPAAAHRTRSQHSRVHKRQPLLPFRWPCLSIPLNAAPSAVPAPPSLSAALALVVQPAGHSRPSRFLGLSCRLLSLFYYCTALCLLHPLPLLFCCMPVLPSCLLLASCLCVTVAFSWICGSGRIGRRTSR